MLTHTRSSRHRSKTSVHRHPAWIVASAMAYMLLVWPSAVHAGDAVLSWAPNTEPDLAGYTVHYGTSPGTYSSVASVGKTTTYTLTGLGAGTYYFAVTAYDSLGNESGMSNEVSKTVVDTTPPVISAVTAGAITSTGATVSWATNTTSSSQVEYGTTTAYGASSTLDTTLVTRHTRTLTGLRPSTTYHFRVTSVDVAGNAAVSADNTFTTSAATDTIAPIISNIGVGDITGTSATVTWTTNEGSTSLVEYGKTTAYGSALPETTGFVATHSRVVTGLSASTTYHYRVRNRDAAGNLGTSGDFTFTTTTAADTTPPVLSGVTASATAPSSAIITWSTDEPATSVVDYGLSVAYGSSSALNTTPVTSHSRTLTNLAPSTVYHYRVRSVDESGTAATSSDDTFTTSGAPDTVAPTISAATAAAITFNSAEITWTTNEAGTSLVQYGTDLSFTLSSALNATPVTSHRRELTGLAPSTVYAYRLITTDAAGNTAQSEPLTFITAAAPDTTPPQDIRDFSATGENRQITLAWANPSDADFVGVRIRYRTDRFPADADDGALLGDFTGQPGQSMDTTHQNLLTGVTYFYSAATYDASGNRQHTVYVSATPSASGSDLGDLQIPAGGCGMIVPRDGDPPGPWKAADLVVMALGALYVARRKRAPAGWPPDRGVIRPDTRPWGLVS